MFEEIDVTPSLKLKRPLAWKKLENICDLIRDRINQLTWNNVPTASVIVSAYNEEMYMLAMLLAMSRLQTKHPIEFIWVNNASTDRTAEIFKQCWFQLIEEKTKWLSYARQAWLNAATGKYVFCTDADILVPSTWIDASLEYFNQNDKLVCFSGWVDGNTLWSSRLYWLCRRIVRKFNTSLTASSSEYFTWQNLVFRRDIAIKSWWYEPGVNLGEDWLIVKKMRSHGDVLSVFNNTATKVISSWRRTANIFLVAKLIYERRSRIFWDKSRSDLRDFSDVR